MSVATTRAPGRARPSDDGDGARPRAQVGGQAVRGQKFDGPADQGLGLPPGHIDPAVDHDTMAGEDDRAGHPGQRFARYPAGDQALEELGVPAGGRP